MIKQSKIIFESIKSGLKELKLRLLFVIYAILIFRIGSFIPIPGINTTVLTKLLSQQQGTIIEMFNMFSGGALSRASIFTLGIIPYISSSIVIQLLTLVLPNFSELKKEGELGRKKIKLYTCYGTLILSLLQSIGIAIGLPKMPGMKQLVMYHGFSFYLTTIISLTCGTIFLMWLSEQITELGIGNGTSTIIFTGILAGLPNTINNIINQAKIGNLNFLFFICIIILVYFTLFFVVFFEHGQRKITVHYANYQKNKKKHIYTIQNSSHLPLKVNMSGVIPAIFASSIILFPATIASWMSNITNYYWLKIISLNLQPDQPIYILLYVTTIIFFGFFYTSLVFSPLDTADNLKKSGAFITGIRPGEQTAKYIHKVMTRLSLIGVIYITFICLIPDFFQNIIKVSFHFGGTSLLIVVVVIMDFITQIQTIIMSSKYESVLKKANLNFF